MTARCGSCSHDYADHGRRGGRCDHTTVSFERLEPEHPDDGVEIRQEWALCDCSYFRGSYLPAAAGLGKP